MDLYRLFDDINIKLSTEQKEKFDEFYKLLIEWNEKINLTAITDYQEVIIKHFLDSSAIVKAYDFSNTGNVIDIGTGAGFPAIPLAILFPDIKFTLLDSLAKRINFIDIVCENLDIENINTIHGRAEDYCKYKNNLQNNYRETFDLAVSRAVANFSSLLELCIPFVKVGGHFVAYKSVKAYEEIDYAANALKILECSIKNTVDYVLPFSDYNRTFIIVEKNKKTDGKYPRKAGTPIKNPL